MIVEAMNNIKSGKRDLRKFGITVGIVLALFGGLLLWRGKDYYYILFCLSTAFLLIVVVVPTILKPIHKVWMMSAVLLGWFMTRIILIVLFYLVVTPIGCLARICGKDFLDLKFNSKVDSYWIPKQTIKSERSEYERQF